MDTGNKPAIEFCKKCKIIKLATDLEELMKDLDVDYEEVRGWVES